MIAAPALLHACQPRGRRARTARVRRGPAGLPTSRAFWLGGLASAALWALALDSAFG